MRATEFGVLLVVTLTVAACGSEELDPACQGQDTPTLELGQGVGGAFAPLMSGAQVGLTTAPQGGLGVTVLARTTGLDLSEGVNFELGPEVDGQSAGNFTFSRRIPCQGPEGGVLSGVVVGFDPIRYASNDDLLELDGKTVDLVVTATDAGGRAVTTKQSVVLVVGG